MASFMSFLTIFIALMAWNFSLALSSRQNMQVSTISAAPTILPEAPIFSPIFSPGVSPDIEPLFPTPGGPAFSPSENSLPTIPSSPSPPNPDNLGGNLPGSVLAFPPSEFMPASAPSSHGASLPLCSIFHLVVLGICIMQLHGM